MRALFKALILSQALFYLTGCESFLSGPSSQLIEDYSGQIDTVFDINGNAYKTIGIGSQIWMAQNLRTNRLNDGTIIPQIKSDSDWNGNYQIGYCWYNNDSIYNSKIYGALYNYYTAKTELLCPIGWHIPSNSEWTTLVNFLGGSEKAGGKLKDYFTPYWSDPNVCYSNNIGFAARPGGRRSHIKGQFLNIRDQGYWWTSTSKSDFYSYSWTMYNSKTHTNRIESSNRDGASVRCIKD
jgi:uncharacterized protein (TIGR02145 family)